MSRIKTIFNYWIRYKKYIFKLQILEMISIIVTSIMPYVNTLIFDKGIGQRNGKILFYAIVGYFVLGGVQALLLYIISMVNVTYKYQYQKDLKLLLLDRFVSHKSTYSTAEIDTIISSDVPNFISIFSDNIMTIIYASIKILIYWGIMFFISWKMTLINLSLLSILLIYNYIKGRERKKQSGQNHEINIHLIRVFNEIIRYVKEIKAIGAQKYAQTRYVRTLDSLNNAIKKIYRIGQKNTTFIQIHNLLTESLFLGIGGWFIISGNMTIGKLVSFIGYAGNSSSELSSIIEMYGSYQSNKKSVEIVVSELQLVQADSKAKDILVDNVEEIQFVDFSFKYEDANDYLIRDVNLVLDNKQINYIIGKSGTGKTTITKCLMGTISQYEGDILYEGVNYNSTNKYSIDSIISWVPQEPIIFSDTIFGNLCLGENFDMEKVVEYCKVCQIYDEIMEMPDKFETIIGDAGVKLSGGQKQRISIVRALLQNKPVIIFDEITSGIDVFSTYKIKSNLNKMAKGKLIVIITHDKEFIVNNAKVFSIEKNTVIEKDNLCLN